MIGVILWSDTVEGKAVVWCEDQGDLAFMGCGYAPFEDIGFFEAGDLLEFDVETDGDFRRVNNPRLVQDHNTIDISARLKCAEKSLEPPMGEIVLFPRPTPNLLASDTGSEVAI